MQEIMLSVLSDPYLCWIGAAIGAAGSLLGGLFGKKSASEAAEKNAALQREFAQNSVQWKVEDAKKAGVHPVYALGAPTHQATPSYVGDTSMPAAMASASQDIGRAIDATRTGPQKLDAYTQTARALELERASLGNDLLRAQIAETTSRAAPPFPSAVDPWTIPGQSGSGVKDMALERIGSGDWKEPGPVSDVGFTRSDTGGLAPVYSKDAKERLEDDWGGMLAWNLRNRILPSVGWNHRGLPKPRPGHAWQFNPIRQEYYEVPLSR